jgi:hypothetical protein
MTNLFEKFIGQTFDTVHDQIKEEARANNLSINVIPDGVNNIDVDDNRLNVWVDLVSDKINKFTIG